MYPHRPPRALRSLRASCARCTTPTPCPTRSALCSSGCGAAACSSTSGGHHIRLQPPSHTAEASITYGCSLHHVRLQPPSRTAAASITYGCSLHHIRSQPPSRTVAASIAYGCSLHHVRLQPPSRTAAASTTYGCSLHHVRFQPLTVAASAPHGLQPLPLTVAGGGALRWSARSAARPLTSTRFASTLAASCSVSRPCTRCAE